MLARISRGTSHALVLKAYRVPVLAFTAALVVFRRRNEGFQRPVPYSSIYLVHMFSYSILRALILAFHKYNYVYMSKEKCWRCVASSRGITFY
jgi:hypothetical protein